MSPNESLTPLNRVVVEPIVTAALREDLGDAGDLTGQALFPDSVTATAELRTREPGIVAGLVPASLAFELVDPDLQVDLAAADGDRLEADQSLMTIRGDTAAILRAERTAVNFLQHLSGIATASRAIVDAIGHTRARLLCTRKTTPNLRVLEKYAVRAGGGCNHRFGLYDGILIKDNHLAALGGDVALALDRAVAARGSMVRIQIEVDTIEQLQAVLEHGGADAVLLDNMAPETLTEAVGIVDGRLVTEASGSVTPDTAAAIAEAGVDYLSSGWITHSAPSLNLGLDFS